MGDEAFLLRAVGIAPRLGMGLLAIAGVAMAVATIRLHPRGSRLKPFTALFAGGILGINLWLRYVGPRVLG